MSIRSCNGAGEDDGRGGVVTDSIDGQSSFLLHA
jgi:hypothetical protein